MVYYVYHSHYMGLHVVIPGFTREFTTRIITHYDMIIEGICRHMIHILIVVYESLMMSA
jgi:hypothetical protein